MLMAAAVCRAAWAEWICKTSVSRANFLFARETSSRPALSDRGMLGNELTVKGMARTHVRRSPKVADRDPLNDSAQF
jgi:hypothetical protein